MRQGLLAPFGLDATDPEFWAKGRLGHRAHDRSAGGRARGLSVADGPVSPPGTRSPAGCGATPGCPGPWAGLPRVAGQRFLGIEIDRPQHAEELRAALGGLKGPLMKVAQLLATIPEALPKEYAAELAQLQSAAPPMGGPFVRRRMAAELGPDWRSRFKEFALDAAAAARSAKSIARSPTMAGRWRASCNIPASRARSRPTCRS